MTKIIISPSALAEIDEIVSHIARTSGDQPAEDFLEGVLETIERLGEFPEIGHARRDLTTKDLRFHVVSNCYIVYRFIKQRVEVVRFIHASRDVASILGARHRKQR
jgi:antitoxin ParD1/3/4/toxin ParE1/3/4